MQARFDAVGAATDAVKLSEALRVALRALAFYAQDKNWSDDDWGVKAVVNPPDYGDAGGKARRAVKRIEKVLHEDYVPRALRE